MNYDVVGVLFRSSNKIIYFKIGGFHVSIGDLVLCTTFNGLEFGRIFSFSTHKQLEEKEIEIDKKCVLERKATAEDINKNEENIKLEKKAFEIGKNEIKKQKLNMNLVRTIYSFDRTKVMFFFTSSERVDFRVLVRRLAYLLRGRVELRQIGIRDEARMLSGMGICGRPFCCSTFLRELHHVSIKMAKEQNISLNPKKISGCCGKLMCCLQYEQHAYAFLNKICPRIGSVVMSPDGEGVIINGNPLTGKYRLRLNSGSGDAERIFSKDSLKVIKESKNGEEKNKNIKK